MRTFAIVMMSLLVASLAFAGDHGPECTGDCCTTKFFGFVDASYMGQLEAGTHEFGVDQFELDVVRKMGGMGVLRADVDWTKAGNGWALDVEQAYMNFKLPNIENLYFSFGKFNAPIGFESVDPVDMYQVSHGLLFSVATPTNLTGAKAKYKFNDNMYLKAYVANGWDRNNETNAVKTYGARFGYHRDWYAFGLNTIQGVFDADQLIYRTVYDIDVTLNPKENWLIGLEYNMGNLANDFPGAQDASWNGFMVMTHYGFNDKAGITLRYDSITDDDQVLFSNGVAQTRSSITVCPTYTIAHGMDMLLEYRMDTSDEDVFLDADNKPTGSNTQIAFEMVYTF